MNIYERVYIDRWIGSVGCEYCALSCMDEPRPEKCPFCGCPDKELDDDTNDMIIRLVIYGKKDEDISIAKDDDFQRNEDSSIGEDDDSDSDDLPTLIGPSSSNEKEFTFAAPSQNAQHRLTSDLLLVGQRQRLFSVHPRQKVKSDFYVSKTRHAT